MDKGTVFGVLLGWHTSVYNVKRAEAYSPERIEQEGGKAAVLAKLKEEYPHYTVTMESGYYNPDGVRVPQGSIEIVRPCAIHNPDRDLYHFGWQKHSMSPAHFHKLYGYGDHPQPLTCRACGGTAPETDFMRMLPYKPEILTEDKKPIRVETLSTRELLCSCTPYGLRIIDPTVRASFRTERTDNSGNPLLIEYKQFNKTLKRYEVIVDTTTRNGSRDMRTAVQKAMRSSPAYAYKNLQYGGPVEGKEWKLVLDGGFVLKTAPQPLDISRTHRKDGSLCNGVGILDADKNVPTRRNSHLKGDY